MTTDASGNLYAAGTFSSFRVKNYVAKWDGNTWSYLGVGGTITFNNDIYSLTTDISGNLYAAGAFQDDGGSFFVAKWNGSTWSRVGGGSFFFYTPVNSLSIDASGNLYMAGTFTNTRRNQYVRKFNSSGITEVGGTNTSTFNGFINSLSTDASGNIYATGYFTNSIGKYYVAKFSNGVSVVPTLTSFTPTTAATGTSVTITGTNFTGATAVSFGVRAAASYSVVNDSTITAMVGTGESGSVSVTTAGGTDALAGFIFVLPNYTWTGTTNSNWSLASNWSNGVLPISTSDVIIPSNKTVYLDNNVTINSLQIASNSRLTLQGNGLTISDILSCDGYITNSISASILETNNNSSRVGTLEVISGSLLLQGSSITVTNTLKVSGGTLNTNSILILGSKTSGQFVVTYPVGGSINGTVTVQRYIPQNQGAAFRDLGVPVFGATVANLSTQTYSYSNGAWSSQLPTGNGVSPGKGYRAQINTASNSVTLSYTGTLATNNVVPSITQGANAYSLIANPYQAVISFDNITKSNIQNGFWYLDPTNLVNGYQGYVFWGSLTGASNTYSGALSINKYIQPGQAFFVQNTSGGGVSSLTFTPSATVSGNRYQVFGTQTFNRISTGLFANGKNLDGAVVVFNNLFSNGNDSYDAAKFSNQGENLTFLVSGKDYCANAWSKPTNNDVLPLHLYNLKASTAYTLKLDISEFNGNGLTAYLKDNVLNTKTLLIGSNNAINFTTTSSNAASFSSRFSIVFGGTPLPVNEILVSAKKIASNKVSIDWNTLGESNVNTYAVESSENGTSFYALVTLKPNTSSRYNYVDAAESKSATKYYRIKAISINGEVSYSKVVAIKLTEQVFSVYPNPVLAGGSFKLSLPKNGNYTIQLINQLGQKVYTAFVVYNGSIVETNIGKYLPVGSYELTATDAQGEIYRSKLFVK